MERKWEDVLRAELSLPEASESPVLPELNAVFHDYRVHRRQTQRRAAFYFVLVLGVGLAAVFGLSRPVPSERPADEDAVRYARSLFDRIYGPSTATSRVIQAGDLLRTDPAARAEYLAALDHPSSNVRRIALTALSDSGIELPVPRLLEVLQVWEENLERDVVVADTGSNARYIAEALERRRLATMRAALDALCTRALDGNLSVSPAALLPHLDDGDAEVRASTLSLLAYLPVFQPGEKTIDLLRADPSARVRETAAYILVKILGETGRGLVFEHLKNEPSPVAQRTMSVGLQGSPQALTFAREQIAHSAGDLSARVMWATWLAEANEVAPGETLIPAVLAGTNPDAVLRLVTFAKRAGRPDLRDRILAAAVGLDTLHGEPVRMAVVRWDLGSGDEARMRAGLELARGLRNQMPARALLFALRQFRGQGSGRFQTELADLIGVLEEDLSQK